MSKAAAADAVLLLHAAFVAWVVLGGLAVLRWPRLAWLHLPALAWGVWIEASGGVCPLTPLEHALRLEAGQSPEGGTFVERYVSAWLYPDGLTREIQFALAALLAAGNGLIYALGWRAMKRRSRRR